MLLTIKINGSISASSEQNVSKWPGKVLQYFLKQQKISSVDNCVCKTRLKLQVCHTLIPWCKMLTAPMTLGQTITFQSKHLNLDDSPSYVIYTWQSINLMLTKNIFFLLTNKWDPTSFVFPSEKCMARISLVKIFRVGKWGVLFVFCFIQKSRPILYECEQLSSFNYWA